MPWPLALPKDQKHCWAWVDDMRAGLGKQRGRGCRCNSQPGTTGPQATEAGAGWLPPDLFSRMRTCLSHLQLLVIGCSSLSLQPSLFIQHTCPTPPFHIQYL